MLGMSPLAFMSSDPRWATYKQAAGCGWQVRKGSRGTPGFFYKKIEVEDRTGSSDDGRKLVPVLRSFTLFNGSQIDGIPPYVAPGLQIASKSDPFSLSIVTPLAGADVACVGLFVTGTELWVSGLPERPSRVWRRQATYP